MYSLRQLADHVGGRVLGDPETPIEGVRPFEEASPSEITLAAERRYLERLRETAAGAVIVPAGVSDPDKSLLQVDNPRAAFARILALFTTRPFVPQGISALAVVEEGCRIADRVTLHPHVFVGRGTVIEEEVVLYPGVYVGAHCQLGRGTVLHANVSLYEGVILGKRVVIHSGSVIGADGFGYVWDGTSQVKIPQVGGVRIGDDVEIGANSCVDRATFGETVLEDGVRLDNHVHIAHNCHIGEHTVIVAQVGISGSVEVGRRCILAGQCGVIDHIRIGDDVTVMVKSAVTKDIPSGGVVSGQPAMNHRRALKLQAMQRRLPDIIGRLGGRATSGGRDEKK